MGTEEDGFDTIESDFAGSVGGRTKLFGHELRFKGVAAREVDYETAEGFQEGLEPRRPEFFGQDEDIARSGSLAFGELLLTKGHYDLTQSEKTKQLTGYGGLGIDLDEAGNHRLDGSIFYTKKQNDAVELKENGYLAGFDYGPAAEQQAMSGQIRSGDRCSRPAWEAPAWWSAQPSTPSSARRARASRSRARTRVRSGMRASRPAARSSSTAT